jgi:flagellar protein FliJ
MKSFRFRLESVLDHRRRLEEEEAQELARVRRKQKKAQETRAELEGLLDAETSALTWGEEANPVGLLRTKQALVDHLRARVDSAADREGQAAEAVIRQRAAYRVAFQEREVLSRLRERKREEWDADGRRREQLHLDETATTRHFRRAEDEAGR